MQQIDIDTMTRWLCGAYGRAYLAATISKFIQWQTYTPLPKNAFYCGGGRTERPTEWHASFLWGNGWISSHAYTDAVYQQPRRFKFHPDWSYVGQTPKPHPEAIGQVCIDCQKRKPLTEDFWHKDSNGEHGFKTVCKVCRNKTEAQRIALKRAS